MIDETLIADCIATRDKMLSEIRSAESIVITLGKIADSVLDWRRYVDGKRAEWEKQSALLDSIIQRLQAAERPEET